MNYISNPKHIGFIFSLLLLIMALNITSLKAVDKKLVLIKSAYPVANFNIPLLHSYGDSFITALSDSDIAALKNINFTILDSEYKNYSLIIPDKYGRFPLDLTQVSLLQRDNSFLVKSDDIPTEVDNLKIIPLKEIVRDNFVRYLNYDENVVNSEEINNILIKLDKNRLLNTIQKLEDFESRHFLNPNRTEIVQWLADEMGSTAEIDSFLIDNYVWGDFPSSIQYNVVGMLSGAAYSDRNLIIGAHYDSIVTSQYTNPAHNAPGADDNASGTAALLEIYKALNESNYIPRKTIKFIPFAAEEIGLYGSRYQAEKYQSEQYRIELLINNDMIAYNSAANTDKLLKIFPYSGYEYIADLSESIFTYFTKLTPYLSTFNNPASDSYSFWQSGFPAVFYHEYVFNPYYHSVNDLVKNIDIDYAFEVTKGSLLTLLYMDKIPAEIENLTVLDQGNGYELSVQWTHSKPDDILRYNLYLGKESRNYDDFYSITELNTIISNLEEETEYFIAVSAVNLDGLESIVTEIRAIPLSTPRTPEKFTITPAKDFVTLSWLENSENDLAAYNIYRSRSLDNLKLIANGISLPYFVDDTLLDKEFYYYAVSAVDNDNRESEKSETIKTRLISLNQNILLVNSSSSNDHNVMKHYDILTANFPTDSFRLNVKDSLSLIDIGPYSTTIIYNDSLDSNSIKIPEYILKEYLDLGGNLILTGYALFNVINKEPDIILIEKDSFAYSYLNIDNLFHSFGSYFSGAVSEQYPQLSVTRNDINNHIFGVYGITPLPEAEIIYRYNSEYTKDTPAGIMKDSVVGILAGNLDRNETGKAAVLTFPLSSVASDGAANFLSSLLADYFMENKWNEQSLVPKDLLLLTNYPNPFNNETLIPFYLASGGKATITIFNIKGQLVRKIDFNSVSSGRTKFLWDGTDDKGLLLPAGVYLLELNQNDKRSFGKALKMAY